jgi:hypothetical protein
LTSWVPIGMVRSMAEEKIHKEKFYMLEKAVPHHP